MEAIKSFVAVGLGASFLPVTSVDQELAADTLKRLRLPHVPWLRLADGPSSAAANRTLSPVRRVTSWPHRRTRERLTG